MLSHSTQHVLQMVAILYLVLFAMLKAVSRNCCQKLNLYISYSEIKLQLVYCTTSNRVPYLSVWRPRYSAFICATNSLENPVYLRATSGVWSSCRGTSFFGPITFDKNRVIFCRCVVPGGKRMHFNTSRISFACQCQKDFASPETKRQSGTSWHASLLAHSAMGNGNMCQNWQIPREGLIKKKTAL